MIPVEHKCGTLRGVRPTVPYRTQCAWAYLYSVLEGDGQNAAEFLRPPEVSLGMSGLFLNHLAASDPDAERVVIWDQAGFHPKPEWRAVPARVPLGSLPPNSPELNPPEAIGDGIKDRKGHGLGNTLADKGQSQRQHGPRRAGIGGRSPWRGQAVVAPAPSSVHTGGAAQRFR